MSQLVAIFRKDLLIEWRGKSRLIGLCCYALTFLLLFSFAVGPDSVALRRHAAAYVWLSVLCVSTLLLVQSFRIETEEGALEGLLLVPVSPAALFYGKALANTLLIVVMGMFALPVAAILFDLSPAGSWGGLFVVLVLGAAGFAAPGTLYSALTARIAAQQLMLPVLLFPLVVPAVLAAVKATSLLLEGDPMGQLSVWLAVQVCFDLIYWSLCGLLFARGVEA
jgi:heme exporter protein B